MPAADTVRVIVAAIGFASTDVSVRASSSSTHENMKQKNAVTPMPALISGRNSLHEEARERVAVDVRRLVDLARHARHEAFEDPHGERHVEHHVRERDGEVRVHEADRGVELEERQQEHGRRRHAVRQQPEEQVLVAEERVARERIRGRQRDRDATRPC